MKTAFEILNINEEATDDEVKQAYLHQVKHYPPDQAPDKFQEIRMAYETIRTSAQRMQYRLFHITPFEVTDLIEHCLTRENMQPPTADLFINTLTSLLNLPINK